MKYVVSIILAVLLYISIPSHTIYADNTWWNNNYSTRKILTFSNNRSEDLEQFPVVVKLTSSNFDFSKAQTEGQDIRLIDSDNKTELAYEIEQWDSSNKVAVVWVKVPKIDAHSNSDFIYMYYGNGTAVNNQSASALWQNGYLGVWHMNQNPTTSNILDSTGNGYHAVPSGSFVNAMVDGKVGKATAFSTGNKLSYSATNGTYPLTTSSELDIMWYER